MSISRESIEVLDRSDEPHSMAVMLTTVLSEWFPIILHQQRCKGAKPPDTVEQWKHSKVIRQMTDSKTYNASL